MDRPSLTGSEHEFDALVEWLRAMATLRHRLQADETLLDPSELVRVQLLARRLIQAENQLRAVVGLPPLMG